MCYTNLEGPRSSVALNVTGPTSVGRAFPGGARPHRLAVLPGWQLHSGRGPPDGQGRIAGMRR